MRIKFLVAAASALFALQAQAGAIVVAADSSAEPMSTDDAKRAFLGRMPSVGGNATTVVYQNGPERAAFEAAITEKSGAELASYWSKLIFTGKAKAPIEVADDAAVKDYVNANPGAIGYVSDAAVDGSVKVLLTY